MAVMNPYLTSLQQSRIGVHPMAQAASLAGGTGMVMHRPVVNAPNRGVVHPTNPYLQQPTTPTVATPAPMSPQMPQYGGVAPVPGRPGYPQRPWLPPEVVAAQQAAAKLPGAGGATTPATPTLTPAQQWAQKEAGLQFQQVSGAPLGFQGFFHDPYNSQLWDYIKPDGTVAFNSGGPIDGAHPTGGGNLDVLDPAKLFGVTGGKYDWLPNHGFAGGSSGSSSTSLLQQLMGAGSATGDFNSWAQGILPGLSDPNNASQLGELQYLPYLQQLWNSSHPAAAGSTPTLNPLPANPTFSDFQTYIQQPGALQQLMQQQQMQGLYSQLYPGQAPATGGTGPSTATVTDPNFYNSASSSLYQIMAGLAPSQGQLAGMQSQLGGNTLYSGLLGQLMNGAQSAINGGLGQLANSGSYFSGARDQLAGSIGQQYAPQFSNLFSTYGQGGQLGLQQGMLQGLNSYQMAQYAPLLSALQGGYSNLPAIDGSYLY